MRLRGGRFRAALVTGALGLALVTTASTAAAQDRGTAVRTGLLDHSEPFTLISASECGKVAPGRSLSTVVTGTFTAHFRLLYTFEWTDVSAYTVSSACGPAAPYGTYQVPVAVIQQSVELTVTGAGITGCTAGSGDWSCSGGLDSRTASHVRRIENASEVSDYTTSTSIQASVCNRATLRVSGYLENAAYSGSTEIVKRSWAC